MKRTIIFTALLAVSTPLLAFDNSATAWEFRRKNCDLIGRVAAASRNESIKGKPKTPAPVDDGKNYLYTLTQVIIGEAYDSKGTAADAYNAGFTKCLDNIDRVYFDFKAGTRTDPADFR